MKLAQLMIERAKAEEAREQAESTMRHCEANLADIHNKIGDLFFDELNRNLRSLVLTLPVPVPGSDIRHHDYRAGYLAAVSWFKGQL